MSVPSHRLRVQQKQLLRRLILTIGLVIGILLFFIYLGLPLIASIILFLTSFKKDKPIEVKEYQRSILPPIVDPVSESTNSATFLLTGIGEPDATIRIFVNGDEKLTTYTDPEGKFKANKILLKEGENLIYLTQKKDELESSPSSDIQVMYKKNPPKLEISDPKDGDTFYGEENQIQVKGVTDPGNKVYINSRIAIVDTTGKFSMNVKLKDGENVLNLESIDDAGNSIKKELKVSYSP